MRDLGKIVKIDMIMTYTYADEGMFGILLVKFTKTISKVTKGAQTLAN